MNMDFKAADFKHFDQTPSTPPQHSLVKLTLAMRIRNIYHHFYHHYFTTTVTFFPLIFRHCVPEM